MSGTGPCLLACDLGTGGNKASLYTVEGEELVLYLEGDRTLRSRDFTVVGHEQPDAGPQPEQPRRHRRDRGCQQQTAPGFGRTEEGIPVVETSSAIHRPGQSLAQPELRQDGRAVGDEQQKHQFEFRAHDSFSPGCLPPVSRIPDGSGQ